ncbi:MAG: hypothetical protein R2753_07675 [Chitinophagales bacterium]
MNHFKNSILENSLIEENRIDFEIPLLKLATFFGDENIIGWIKDYSTIDKYEQERIINKMSSIRFKGFTYLELDYTAALTNYCLPVGIAKENFSKYIIQ